MTKLTIEELNDQILSIQRAVVEGVLPRAPDLIKEIMERSPLDQRLGLLKLAIGLRPKKEKFDEDVSESRSLLFKAQSEFQRVQANVVKKGVVDPESYQQTMRELSARLGQIVQTMNYEITAEMSVNQFEEMKAAMISEIMDALAASIRNIEIFEGIGENDSRNKRGSKTSKLLSG